MEGRLVMRKFFLLNKVFLTRKTLIYSFLNSILKFIIILFIIIFTLVPIINYQFATDGYQYGKYDVMVSESSEYTYNKFVKDSNVKSLIGLSGQLPGSTIYKGSKQVTGSAILVYDNDFNVLREILLTDDLFIRKDERLMERDDAILLSYSYMLALDASIGDVIRFDEENLEYVLAGVYKESVSWTSMAGISIIVLADSHKGVLLNLMDEILGGRLYGAIFMCFHDKQAGIDNINANYYRDFRLYKAYGENYLEEAPEEELLMLKSPSIVRTEHLKKMELSFKYSESPYQKSYAYFITPIGMLMIYLLTIQENNKRIQLGLKSIAILSINGVSKLYIFIYLLFDSFIKMSILQILALWISQLIFIAQDMYTPADLLIKYTMLYIFSIFLASAISAFVSMRKIGDEHLMATLSDEDIQEDLL